jgi:dethiobiotin synthetase
VTLRRIFVTGTDTDVGKTVASAVLTLGLDGYYWKPIQCGTDPETDRESVRRWTGLPPERFLEESYSLQAPLSPHAAAAMEGVEISLDRILSNPLPRDRPLVIEGAGGLLVPIHRGALVADLIEGLEVPTLLVARTSLGTLNHTLLSISEIRRRGIPLLGVLLNGEENVSNHAAIEEYGRVRVLGRIPHLATLSRETFLDAFRRVEFDA